MLYPLSSSAVDEVTSTTFSAISRGEKFAAFEFDGYSPRKKQTVLSDAERGPRKYLTWISPVPATAGANLVTGFDLIQESGRELDELADLEFGRCRK